MLPYLHRHAPRRCAAHTTRDKICRFSTETPYLHTQHSHSASQNTDIMHRVILPRNTETDTETCMRVVQVQHPHTTLQTLHCAYHHLMFSVSNPTLLKGTASFSESVLVENDVPVQLLSTEDVASLTSTFALTGSIFCALECHSDSHLFCIPSLIPLTPMLTQTLHSMFMLQILLCLSLCVTALLFLSAIMLAQIFPCVPSPLLLGSSFWNKLLFAHAHLRAVLCCTHPQTLQSNWASNRNCLTASEDAYERSCGETSVFVTDM